MSFALENKHKQSRENIEETNNNLGRANKPWENKKTKTKEQTKTNKTILRDSWLEPPLSSRLPQNCFFFCLFVLLCLFVFFVCLMFLAPPRSKYCLALPAATKNIQKILAGNPPPPESLKI